MNRAASIFLSFAVIGCTALVARTMLRLPPEHEWPAVQFSSPVDREWQAKQSPASSVEESEFSQVPSMAPKSRALTPRKPNPPPVPITNLTYTWDYDGFGWVFDVVSSTNYAVPLKQWSVLASNVVPPVTVGVTNAQRFYAVRYTNTYWPFLNGYIAKN